MTGDLSAFAARWVRQIWDRSHPRNASPDYPLRQWRVRNFKSIEEATVDLAPLTVVVGPNSSGKSTLLQSLLFVHQSMTDSIPSDDATFSLNGDSIGLGAMSDVRRRGEHVAGGKVAIGGTLAFPGLFQAEQLVSWDVTIEGTPSDDSTARVRSLDARAFGEGEEVLSSLTLERSTNAVDPNADDREGGLAHFVAQYTGEVPPWLDVPPAASLPTVDRHMRNIGASRGVNYFGEFLASQDGGHSSVVATDFAAFAPSAVHLRQGYAEAVADLWFRHPQAGTTRTTDPTPRDGASEGEILDWASDQRRRVRDEYRRERALLRAMKSKEPYSEELLEAVVRFAYRRACLAGPGLVQARELVERLLPTRDLAELKVVNARHGTELRERIVEYALGHLGPSEPREAMVALDFLQSEVGRGLSCVTTWFRGSVHYLGPLRQEPRPLFEFGPQGLGKRGERAALMMHRLSHAPVLCPPHPEDQPHVNEEHHSVALPASAKFTLPQAVAYWASYLGLAAELQTQNPTRQGVTLNVVAAPGGPAVDSLSVGVGVSQLLPVLIICLTAAPGSLILLEQPELHLHPKVQQRLADFFLAIARTGRQLVIETHSEYLVTRLRRRIAEDPGDDTRKIISLLFSELEVDEFGSPCTRFREVKPSFVGTLEDWPQGFFDESISDAQVLLEAAVEKITQRKMTQEEAEREEIRDRWRRLNEADE